MGHNAATTIDNINSSNTSYCFYHLDIWIRIHSWVHSSHWPHRVVLYESVPGPMQLPYESWSPSVKPKRCGFHSVRAPVDNDGIVGLERFPGPTVPTQVQRVVRFDCPGSAVVLIARDPYREVNGAIAVPGTNRRPSAGSGRKCSRHGHCTGTQTLPRIHPAGRVDWRRWPSPAAPVPVRR